MKSLPEMRIHQHPDGTVVASATLSDGRVLRCIGPTDMPGYGPAVELWKTLWLLVR